MRLIIAGGRDFNDYPQLSKEAKLILKGSKRKDIEIISGTARGADLIGEMFAEAYQLHLTRMPADWNQYGKSAGYRRNAEMATYANKEGNGYLLAFWDGKSRGTMHMIDLAHKHNLQVKICSY